MASLSDLLKNLGVGRLVPILTRRGKSIGDVFDNAGAAARADLLSEAPGIPTDTPPIDLAGFDENRMIPFVSSNVEGGYFNYYYNDIGQKTDLGVMYLLFQKRRPEVPGGTPQGPPRAYEYANCPEYVWDAIFEAGSKGGAVHDVVIRGGVLGDRIL